MARHEIVVFRDDLDGTEEDVKPVKFGFDGVSYEIDLGPSNYAKLRELLVPYIDAGSRLTGRATVTRGVRVAPARRAAAAAEHKEFNARVREWAPSQGYKVKPRGRVPEKVIEAYVKAGNK